jgi:opacity protein-like surface antigen
MKSLFVHCQYLAVLLAIGGLGVSSLGFAGVAPANPFQNIEFSVAGGPSWNHIHDTSLLISSYETDNVLVSHVSTTGVWKIGAGYHLLSPALEQNPAYDLGVGTRFALNSHLGASLEYLYTEVGSNVTSYATSQTPAAIVSAPRFKVSSQALLLGLNWTI